MDYELEQKKALWRQKAADGTISLEEMREAVAVLRGSRRGAAVTSEASRRKKAAAIIPSADDLLAEMGDAE